ncbi:ABC transporter ATP-binding protein [Aquamicrobium sp. LC103]|uniref:ABC transporter ATP-binding protein n=1 Tax=Aquamicrobium sp. LC103 TaxID=1120658 RepID=UPI00063EA6F9|nr:ABC transporter ATP-binding protein [Aquamicrobium sp. LC103]TKT75794.1 ABC transporter ATP-binding protein [Aquamicrobium sp. LC103]
MLSIKNLTKVYPARGGAQPVDALRGVDLKVEQGEFFALLGPSGCGKTTILQSIAGLEMPTSGDIVIGDKTVFDAVAGQFIPAAQRHLGMVFQSYAIWPHMTVFDNVAFPLRHGRKRASGEELRRRVMAALERVKLAAFANRPAPHLSGGQQQRVAIARAIVHEPRLLLLDEPLSNLDARLRDAMREELRAMVKELGITTIFVTHDQVEAMGMADRIAIIDQGRIMQIGQPEQIYFSPRNAFVANFIGRSNTVEVKVTGTETSNGRTLQRLAAPMGELVAVANPNVSLGDEVLCIIRPQAFVLGGVDAENRFEGHVVSRSFLGDHVELDVAIAGVILRIVAGPYDTISVGSRISLSIPYQRCVVVARDRV